MSSPVSDKKEDEHSLSELCSICYTEPPKYRCPRCSTRTCSLLCYKRHQQRASCSGQRDPAAYRKRSQLATPAALDQDYNFLKGVERHIDVANRDVVERGIGGGRNAAASATASAGGPPKQKAFARGMNPDGPVQQYLASNRIRVSRAPVGMSRQRMNQTRCTKNKRIMWTVEWVDLDGQITTQDSCLESNSLAELYRALRVEKANAAKRKLTAANQIASASNAKRQRGAETKSPAAVIAPAAPETTSFAASDPSTEVPVGQESAVNTSELQNRSHESVSNGDGHEDSATGAPPAVDGREDKDLSQSGDASSAVTQIADEVTPTSSSPDPFFYLLKPSTTGTAKVLIPMDASKTLTEVLSTRVVLEYPTFHILPHSPNELTPAGSENKQQYITEENYLASQPAREAQEATEFPLDAGQGFLNSQSSARADINRSATGANATMLMSAEQRASMNSASHEDDALRARQEVASKDPNKILEMLRRDLSGMM